MDKYETKKILKVAAFIFLFSFITINWDNVSWIFNYKEVYGLVSDFFNPYPSIDALTIKNVYFHPDNNQNITVKPQTIENVKTITTDKQNILEIPKISISAPIVFAQSLSKESLSKDLDSGVVYYPGSVYPGQTGEIVILGHSAPLGWPKTKYEWVFSDLEKLSQGDEILIDMNYKQYKYIVKQKTVIKRGADIPEEGLDLTNNVLTLISCWPPGKDYQRITVQAELEKGL